MTRLILTEDGEVDHEHTDLCINCVHRDVDLFGQPCISCHSTGEGAEHFKLVDKEMVNGVQADPL